MSWSEKNPSKKPEPFQFAPDWFVAAYREGKPEQELIERVREFCRDAERYEAERDGKPIPTTEPDEHWVMMMYDAYRDSIKDGDATS